MKLKKLILSIILGTFFLLSGVFAAELNFGDFLTIYFEGVSQGTENFGTEWKNIDVKYTNVKNGSELYKALQKGIYLNYFPNTAIDLPLDKVLDQKAIVNLLETKIGRNFKFTDGEKVSIEWTNQIIKETLEELDINEQIKDNIIDQLKDSYLYGDQVDWSKCNDISECINLLDDNYTEYINSGNAVEFIEQLEGNFEGIGAYIQAVHTGIFIISDIIPGGPAEKGGLKSGDIFLKVDNHTVTTKTTLSDLVSYIKGRSGTTVKIQVRRGNENLSFNIKRGNIVLKNVSYRKLDGGACYMKIEQFNQDTLGQFEKGLKFFDDNSCNTYIFDIRDNPGGQLDVVVNMLNHFVADGETILELRYNGFIQDIIADAGAKIHNQDTLVLVNNITASASEIFAGVLADYLPNFKMIGSKTYGKGSAQNVVEYVDGSILKYTVAKRYTGKTKTNIDGKGFEPNIQMSNEKIESFLKKLGFK